MADFIPFDPKKHKPVDAVSLGLPNAKEGMNATEYLASEPSPGHCVGPLQENELIW